MYQNMQTSLPVCMEGYLACYLHITSSQNALLLEDHSLLHTAPVCLHEYHMI